MKVKKRDGRIVEYERKRIEDAIRKALAATHEDESLAPSLAEEVEKKLVEKFTPDGIPSVEEIQDVVEGVLIKNKLENTARAYILYRKRRSEIRKTKKILTGVHDDLKLSINALTVLERRYLLKDEKGKVIETPGELFKRVAKNIAEVERNYGVKEVEKIEEEFYRLMTSGRFLPNSPTLMNAGTSLQQLAACFVLPVGDSIEEIFDALKYAAIIHKTGGGTGFNFSHLRPKNDTVLSTGGIASGPVSFMRIFDTMTEVIKQGGKRRGANMGILNYNHPDIMEFITCKEHGDFRNFNISVGVTEEFFELVKKDGDVELINPRTGKSTGKIKAKTIFETIVFQAWKTGDPGIVFLDRLERDNPTPSLGKIEATNPCGEQPLLPYEACNLGSVNLSLFVKNRDIDFEPLENTVKLAVRFLDNVIDASRYPLPEIEKMVRGNRKIGLGVMGFADMLIKLKIPYDSEEALRTAERVMKFIKEKAEVASRELALERGNFPNHGISIFKEPRRNATLTTIAPTGSISIIAGCSSGIEPLFSIVFMRNVLEGTELLEINQEFERIAKETGFYSEELIHQVAARGTLENLNIPEEVKRIFRTAHDISPEWHIRMQAAFQKYVDNAVSKTVNLRYEATVEDVRRVFWLGYELGVKGVTVYRDRSKEEQVLYKRIDTGGCRICRI
ncbi:adenosylcobalamin-dependent ribonucleoside-diphosphate reductase [bacterium]|nr:MAG: adenosylcobalamin-dependent ribonucleoside-diphosphate reductase [bacterium]